MSDQLSSLNLRKDQLAAMLCDPFLTINKADELYEELYDVCDRIDHLTLTPTQIASKRSFQFNSVQY